MEPTETYEEATKCARSAIKTMAEKRIVPYPRSFTIWYIYFSKKYPDLNAVLDKFFDKEGYFTEDRNTLIYQKFFGFDQLGRTVREVTSGASKALGDAFEHVRDLCSETKGARKDIEACCSRLEKAKGSDQLRELVDEMLDRVRKLDDASQAMEIKLSADYKKMAELHRSIEESQRESMTDALTGLANRKLFDACLRLTADDARKSASLCVILMDVDNMGGYNDKHGYAAGDEALRIIATALSETVKGRDLAARHGDDEFAVLTTRTLLPDSSKLARNFRGAVGIGSRVMDVDVPCGMEHRITLSIGVAQYEPGESIGRLLERVKHALSAAKANGRNQVISAEKTTQGIMLWDEDHVVVNPRNLKGNS